MSPSSEQPSAEDAPVRPRVLVVEDNADTRTLMRHLLRKHYAVDIATQGEQALEMAKANIYEAVLLDINLGKGRSGEQVLHQLRVLDGYAKVPVIAVTAYAMPGDRERFFAEGFDDYVSKPFSKQQLFDAIDRALA